MATSYGEVRIGDAEREQAVSALGEHYLAGRLTKEEYDERTAVAWSARTASALHPLFADLPRQQAVVSQPAPKQKQRSRRRFPVFPVAVALVVLLIVLNVPWWGWVIFAWMWCSGMFAGMSHHLRHSRRC